MPSGVDFAVEDGAILYSLAALKNVGAGAIEHIVQAREEGGPFKSLGDFAKRIDARILNKRALESLAKAGAFDASIPTARRCSMRWSRSSPWPTARRVPRRPARTTCSAARPSASDDLVLPRRDAWLPMDRLAQEFEAVGFYLSGHPLDDYMKPLQKLSVSTPMRRSTRRR